MLNEVEKKGCRNILQRLSVADLYSLVDTITKKLIRPSNTEEAIEAILNYSDNPTELLQRRKVKRDVLFLYLNDKKVKVALTADKKGLVIEILKEWGSLIDYDMLETAGGEDSLRPSGSLLEKSNATSVPASHDKTHQSDALPPGPNPATFPGPSQVNIQVHNHFHSPGATAQTSFHFSPPPSQPAGDTNVNHGGGQKQTASENQTLSAKFVEWFYDIINSHNPVIGSAKDFGPHHFWDDVVLTVFTPNKTEEQFRGPIAVADCFLNYTKNEGLLFNANVSSEGLVVKSNPHGLVAIMVCGTVHRGNECLGVFQQAFGIIRDPRFHNNWKIKMSKLQVSADASSSVPKLPSSAERDLLAIM